MKLIEETFTDINGREFRRSTVRSSGNGSFLNRMRFVEKMLTEEQAAAAYDEATDGCRRLGVQAIRDNSRQWQRVKPDEVHPLAEVDWEEGVTWNESLVTTPLLHLSSERTDCTALKIQPPATSGPPNGKDCVAAM